MKRIKEKWRRKKRKLHGKLKSAMEENDFCHDNKYESLVGVTGYKRV